MTTKMMMMMMMMVMKSDAQSAAPADVLPVSAVSGGAVLLTSDLLRGRMEPRRDIRWTHLHLLLSLKNNMTTCHHGRCKLQSDGSLRFSHVQAADAGNYSLEVFDGEGRCLQRKHFLLTVNDVSSSSQQLPALSVCFLLLLLLLIFITFFILRKRKSQRMRAAGPMKENVYMAMHSHHGNNKKEEECDYVPCGPVVSMETPITQQLSVDVEDIYV